MPVNEEFRNSVASRGWGGSDNEPIRNDRRSFEKGQYDNPQQLQFQSIIPSTNLFTKGMLYKKSRQVLTARAGFFDGLLLPDNL